MKERLDPFNSASWDEEERACFTSVERAFRARENMLISNGKPEHAAYLIKLFIANAESRVRLVSGGLPLRYEGGTAVFGSRYIVAAVLDFLSRPDTTLNILLHGQLKDVDSISEHPFVWAPEMLKARGELQGALMIQQISDPWETAMEEADMLWHWMTMDESAYRLERDVTKPAAIANFGEPDYARDLVRAFETISEDKDRNKVIASVRP